MMKKGNLLKVLIPLLAVGAVTAYVIRRKTGVEVTPEQIDDILPFRRMMNKYLGEEADAEPVPAPLLNHRQERILSLIADTQGITTPEINKRIRNINERTLRRDLNLLIDIGLVRKEGSTKSSRYYTV